ncbi:HAD family hydrolase [Micromonospora endolithica]|uniref:HAD family hydrolase n=1 Tax=Micromonospora endolithica TaxID=230091 RepID=A0A3A9Z5K8_9ACTN|nr:HAD family hydrolase [Micromonospora endolithica]RKN43575.1 HAD family hydrolase [Micromonospora endolithica]TWJ24177.1 putative hydrolase of the HAD superfamily [Micromonospora endolithica]
MPAYQAVLFDFFGTLTRPVQRGAAHSHVADLLGCSRNTLVDVLDRTFYQRASGLLGDAQATLRWVCEQVGVHPTDQAVRHAVAARHRAVRADTRLRDDAVPTLAALRRRGVRTGIVSDCTHELPAFLPQLPIAPLLDVRVFSVEVGRCKPDPALYLAACHRLGVAPEDCLFVGDGGSQELTGARRTGMTAVRLAADDLAGHLVFNADDAWRGPVLRRLTEVVALLDATMSPPAAAPPAVLPAAVR